MKARTIRAISIGLTFCAAVIVGIAVAAPFIGLGETDKFLFYQWFGFDRTRTLYLGIGIAGTAGFLLLLKSLYRRFKHALIWLRTISLAQILRAMKPDRQSWIIITVSAIVAIAAFEVYARFTTEQLLADWYASSSVWIQNETLQHTPVDDVIFNEDNYHEFGLLKARKTFNLLIKNSSGHAVFSVRSNNVGLLSDSIYQPKRHVNKPEYRIVVLGESFTGTVNATYQWVDTLEELLNNDEVVRTAVNGKTIRTYNVSLVGAGFPDFSDFYRRSGRHFTPDLVLVNYLELDFPRTGERRLIDETATDQMIAQAATAIKEISAGGTPVIATVMPSYQELKSEDPDYNKSLDLAEQVPGIPIHLTFQAVRSAMRDFSVDDLFNTPFDEHYSDRGGEIYARVLAGIIAKTVTGKKIDFSNRASRYAPNVLFDRDAPKTRRISPQLSPIFRDPDAWKEIRNQIKTSLFRRFSRYDQSFAIHRLLNTAGDGVNLRPDRQVIGGFKKIEVGSERLPVYLNVFCLDKPIDLSRLSCLTYSHVFAG